jgi:hypothetical protein
METEKSKERNRPSPADRLKDLPADLAAECRRISREVGEEREEVREAKVIAAKIRMDTNYYDSDNVLRIVASRMLDESQGD